MPVTVAAAEPALDRAWSAEQLDPGGDPLYWDVSVGSTEPGQTVAVHAESGVGAPDIHALVRQPGDAGFGAPQVLDSNSFLPALDSSAAGAVAAWYHQPTTDIKVATMGPAESEFGSPLQLSGTNSGYSYERPQVAIGDDGAAAVLYLAPAPGGMHQLTAVVRPAGGAFGAPEPIGDPQPALRVFGRDLEVGEDGTVIAGFGYDGQNAVAVRTPEGTWGPVQILGPAHEHSWQSPRVGLDGASNAVAVWTGPSAGFETSPVMVAFAPAGQEFGAPIAAPLQVTEYDGLELAVSRAGLALVVAEASIDNPYGGTVIQGIHAFYGNTTLGRIGYPAALTGIWGSLGGLGANARGDAVVVWDECCPMALRARRKPPVGSFGPAVDVQPPIEFTGVRQGRWPLDAHVDEFGNAAATWTDTEPEPPEIYAGVDGPLLDAPLPEPGALADQLPPVLPGAPAGPYSQPGTPVTPVLPDDGRAPSIRIRFGGEPLTRSSRWIAVRVTASEDVLVRLRPSARGVPKLPRLDGVLLGGRRELITLSLPRRARRPLIEAAKAGRPLRIRGSLVDRVGNVSAVDERLRLGR